MDPKRSHRRAWALCFWIFLSPLLFCLAYSVLSAPLYLLTSFELAPESASLDILIALVLILWFLFVLVFSAFFVWWVWKRVRQRPPFSDSSSPPLDAA